MGKRKWYHHEATRWLMVSVCVAGLFYMMGLMHSFQNSAAQAAYDCRNYASFQYEDEYYVCQMLSNGRD